MVCWYVKLVFTCLSVGGREHGDVCDPSLRMFVSLSLFVFSNSLSNYLSLSLLCSLRSAYADIYIHIIICKYIYIHMCTYHTLYIHVYIVG